jgi:transposase
MPSALCLLCKLYSTNLTQDQWELIEPLIPEPLPGGRPREVDMWEVLNAIFYILCEGCRWRALPGDFPNWQTVYTSESQLAPRSNLGKNT